ncbi:MAG: GNAT family N-acetyltransferase [Alteromonadaceae bacterium]|nr:GNAT family N-acetyltransferase [Alteromonadaceae bacterium]|tara:strand:+ start:81 stop:521 length:441 start_codon:yes stop_codon:yes gene_type:complete
MLEITKADIAHAERIQALLVQLGYNASIAEVKSGLNSQDPHSDLYVARLEGRVIAFMSLIYFYYFPIQKQNCRITAIVVDEEVRITGVGRQLIQFAQVKARQHACAQLEVTTSLERKATQAYYEHNGFIKASFRYYLNLPDEALNI